MTYNLWHGGEAGGQPLNQTIRVIEAANADVVGLQETGGLERDGAIADNARSIAEKLGWHYFDQGERTGVISRHRILDHTPKRTGVRIELGSDEHVWLFNVHFAHAPYQPYQLLRIPYADAPFIQGAERAVAAAREARGPQVDDLLAEVERSRGEKTPIFITGDFNEPSALDWTDDVFQAGGCPVAVRWPSTASVIEAGFVDAYRHIYPDPLTHPGHTWTPTTSVEDPKDRHDRIDFVFVGGRYGQIEQASVVGERPGRADVVLDPYPSDHRAVVATVRLATP
jgi:exonuclease III